MPTKSFVERPDGKPGILSSSVLNSKESFMYIFKLLPHQPKISSPSFFSISSNSPSILLSALKMDYNIIETAKCGFVIEPESSEAIVKGINEIYNLSEEQRRDMGKNGMSYIFKHNTFDILAKRLVSVLTDLSNTNKS